MAAWNLRGQRVVVLGCDESALSLLRFLIKKGALPVLVDTRSQEVIDTYFVDSEIETQKFRLELGEISSKTFENTALAVVSPWGLRHLSPKLWEFPRQLNVPLVSELEFVAQHIDDDSAVAFVSSSGKTLSAHLAKGILEKAGKSVFANIDMPLAEALHLAKKPDHYFLVIEPLQLELTETFKPGSIVLHNVSEDYFDRYQTFENYLNILRQAFRHADEKTQLIVNLSDPVAVQLIQGVPGQILRMASFESKEGTLAGWYDKGNIYIRQADTQRAFSTKNFRLRGPLNRENLLAASLVALSLGASLDHIASTIEEIRTLPGRLEFIKRANFVAFYDDSYASNPNAIIRTLNAFYEPVILISGGRDRHVDYTPLSSHIRQRVKNLILVGESKEKLNRMLGDFTETFLVGTVEEAVLMAYQKSRSGDVILFSPGCEHTDLFTRERGRSDFYKKLINQITQPRKQNLIL